jgi:hypothetical protein
VPETGWLLTSLSFFNSGYLAKNEIGRRAGQGYKFTVNEAILNKFLKYLPFQFTNRESMDLVATEYGVAYLMGKTMRERAQELIDIAHPDDREEKPGWPLPMDAEFLLGSRHDVGFHLAIL